MPASETSLVSIIEAKRDGRALSPDQITAVVQGAANGTAPDYQLAAWLMAVFFRGMNSGKGECPLGRRGVALAELDGMPLIRRDPIPLAKDGGHHIRVVLG